MGEVGVIEDLYSQSNYSQEIRKSWVGVFSFLLAVSLAPSWVGKFHNTRGLAWRRILVQWADCIPSR